MPLQDTHACYKREKRTIRIFNLVESQKPVLAEICVMLRCLRAEYKTRFTLQGLEIGVSSGWTYWPGQLCILHHKYLSIFV